MPLTSALCSWGGRALNAARWRHGVFWPVLVPTDRAWEEYLRGLSQHGRDNHKKAKALNAGVRFEAAAFSPERVRRFMDLWARHFRFPDGYLSRLEALAGAARLSCFEARAGGETIALQLVETYGPYGRCHAPWFDKAAFEKRLLATFMWFSLFEHAMRTRAYGWLDLWDGPPARLPPEHYKRRYRPLDDGSIVRACGTCAFMFVTEAARLRGPLRCPSCAAPASVDWKGRAVLALSRLRKPAFARTRRPA